jgi:hypothetical protein
MGLGIKIVIVKEDGSLERLPVARYNRLLQRDPDERQLQYADKRVRCAIIVFEVVDRRPVEILKSQYAYLSFDSEGQLRLERDEEKRRLTMDLFEPLIADRNKQIVDTRHKFARKRYALEYLWQPSSEIETAIRKAILGRPEGGRN